MPSTEYYFQTDCPNELENLLSKKLDWQVELEPISWENSYDKPYQIEDFEDWFVLDSQSEWFSDEHLFEVKCIRECSHLIRNSLESHDTCLDSWWKIGQGLEETEMVEVKADSISEDTQVYGDEHHEIVETSDYDFFMIDESNSAFRVSKEALTHALSFGRSENAKKAIRMQKSKAQGSLRTVRIVSSFDDGVSEFGYGTIDSNPDRTIYHLEAINCSISDFMDWFFETENASDFCTDGESLIDIGGSTMSLTIGQTLSVSFSEWFEAWLDRKVENAKSEIASSVEIALANI